MSVSGFGSCGSRIRNLLLVVREDRVHLLELLQTISSSLVRLATLRLELADLALDLLDLLDHHLAQQTRTELADRDDRTGATTTLVGGDLVRSVVALVAHVCHSTFVRCRCQARGKVVWTDCG